jgi:hypothetical protein
MAQRGRGRGGREQPVSISTANPNTTVTTEPIFSLKFDNDSAGKLEELYYQVCEMSAQRLTMHAYRCSLLAD